MAKRKPSIHSCSMADTNTSQFFATEDAKEIRHNPNPDWQDFMHLGVDYDRNIIEKYSDLIQ